MERAGTWERSAERWEAEYKMFKETQPMLYLADIKKAYPSAPRRAMWDLLEKMAFLHEFWQCFDVSTVKHGISSDSDQVIRAGTC